jgi:hypothetical protein
VLELWIIALSFTKNKVLLEGCSEVMDKSATGSGQYFRKTFKKSLKMLIPLQHNPQDEPHAR